MWAMILPTFGVPDPKPKTLNPKSCQRLREAEDSPKLPTQLSGAQVLYEVPP